MHRLRRRHRNPRPRSSCLICHQRKVKCDTKAPCGQCTRRGEASECVYQEQRGPGDNQSRTSQRRSTVSPPPARTSTESRENGIAGPHPGDAAVDRENVRHPSSNDSSNVSTSRQSIGSQSQPWRPSPLLCSEARDPSSHFSSSTSDKTSRAESGLPTHDWGQEDPIRGRSHFSWAVQQVRHLFPPSIHFHTAR